MEQRSVEVSAEQVAGPAPLAGITVIEVGDGTALAFCGKLLAALGASVVKVEPPDGSVLRRQAPFARNRYNSESSLLFLYLNTNKQGVTLNLSCASGKALLRRLITHADVVIAEGVVADVDVPALVREVAGDKPSAIVTSISPFGQEGPYSSYKATELVQLALGGLLNMVGSADREPIKLGGHQAAYSTGLSAFTGTLLALHAREAASAIQHVSVTGMETVAFIEWKSGIYFQADGDVRKRGLSSTGFVLPCSDGFVGLYHRVQDWPNVLKLFAEVDLTDERFRSPEGRAAHYEALKARIASASREREKEEIYRSAQALGIPVGLVAHVPDLLASPQYATRDYFRPIDHPSTGPIPYPSFPCLVNGVRMGLQARAPLHGEHNTDVYARLVGLDADALAALREGGVL